MRKERPKLEPGRMYLVDITVGPLPGTGRLYTSVGKTTHTVMMKLIEKRSNGIYWFERATHILLDPPYTGRRDHKWRKGIEIVKVRQSQIRASA